MTLPSVVELDYRQIKYKPGWTFDLIEEHGYGYALQVSAHVPESSSGAPIRIQQRFPCERYPSMEFAFECVMRLERHEAAEVFEVDGVKPFWPH